MERRLMDDREAAAYIGISRYTLNQLRRRNAVPYVRIPTQRRFYYEKNSLDIWLNQSLQAQSVQQEPGKKLQAVR